LRLFFFLFFFADPGWKGDVRWAWKAFWTKFKWMLVTLILPKILLGKALGDLSAARRSPNSLITLKIDQGHPLSDAEISNWTLSHAYYSDMGGFCFRTSSLWSHGKDCQLQYITADDLLKLRAKGHIATITEHEIKDKSNGDCIVKAMAVIQVSWLVIQVMLRATRNFPISQLEITACAFAA